MRWKELLEMPKTINPTAKWTETLAVPRAGEGVKAVGVEVPFGDLLANDKYLKEELTALSTKVVDVKPVDLSQLEQVNNDQNGRLAALENQSATQQRELNFLASRLENALLDFAAWRNLADKTMSDLLTRVKALETSGGGTGTGGGTGGTGGTTPPNTSAIAASFLTTATSGTLEGQFVAQATSSTPITAYEWAFGDGQTGSGQTTQHTYAQAGRYDVTLVARDSSGGSKNVQRRHFAPPTLYAKFPVLTPEHTLTQVAYCPAWTYSTGEFASDDYQVIEVPEVRVDAVLSTSVNFGPIIPTEGVLELDWRRVPRDSHDPHVMREAPAEAATESLNLSVAFDGGDWQAIGSVSATPGDNSHPLVYRAIGASFPMPPAGAQTIRIKVSTDSVCTCEILRAQLRFTHPSEPASPLPSHQTLVFTGGQPERLVAAVKDDSDRVDTLLLPPIVERSRALNNEPDDTLRLFAQRYVPLGWIETYRTTHFYDVLEIPYLLPENAVIVSAKVLCDTAVQYAGGATEGDTAITIGFLGGAESTPYHVSGTSFSADVTLPNRHGTMSVGLKWLTPPTMPDVGGTPIFGEDPSNPTPKYTFTASNVRLEIEYTTP